MRKDQFLQKTPLFFPVILFCAFLWICTGCEQLELENPASIASPATELSADISESVSNDDFFTKEQQNAPVVSSTGGTPIEGQYIVMFNEGTMGHQSARMAQPAERTETNDARVQEMEEMKTIYKASMVKELAKYKISSKSIKKVIHGKKITGAVLTLDQKSLKMLGADTRVKKIEQDRMYAMSTIDPATRRPMIPSSWALNHQFTNYGANRVGGTVDKTGSRYWVWIVDTGIDLDHPDLNVNSFYSKNFVISSRFSNPNGDDGHGHGTHVAGIVGAKNNSFGAKGVAAGVPLVSVKVMDDQGSGSLSELLMGLAWVEFHGIRRDVVNLSLGGDTSTLLDDAIEDLANQGIKVVIAAGNDAKNTINVSPARVNKNNVYTISSTDFFNKFCSFSNYGSSVDYAAPGWGILSTFPNGKYGFMSGTSMSAPHAAGVLIITHYPSSSGRAINDPDGTSGDPLITH